jgi:hypothetical protein
MFQFVGPAVAKMEMKREKTFDCRRACLRAGASSWSNADPGIVA